MIAFKTLVVAALPLLAIANPLAIRTEPSVCNSGSLQCCNKTEQTSSTLSTILTGLLGVAIPVGNLQDLLGLGCNPINVIGVGGSTCTSNTVCCTGNTYNGLVAVGCSPITL